MRDIVITGATGVVGRRAVRELLSRGHRVLGVTRSARGRSLLESLGARAIDADVFDQPALESAFAGADIVINLLTHVPRADRLAVPGAWEENDRLRREASAVVARAAKAAGVGRLIQESVAFLYADAGDAWMDEGAAVVGGGPTTTALAAETNATNLFAGDTVIVRFGMLIGPDSHLSRANVDDARRGISPSVGRRDAYQPTLWLDDAGSAVTSALVAPAGVYNVADDDPPTRADIDAALAAVVGRDALVPPVVGVPSELEPVSRSQRVSSRKLREATGWTPRVRAGTEGWRLIAEAWSTA